MKKFVFHIITRVFKLKIRCQYVASYKKLGQDTLKGWG